MPTWRSVTTGAEWRTVGENPPHRDNAVAGAGPWTRVADGWNFNEPQAVTPRPVAADNADWGRFTIAQGVLGELLNLAPAKVTESLSSRSSSKPQDPAYQIEESLESLGQELEDLVAAKEALSTQVEVLEEMSTVIRSHISTLQTVASQLRTSSPSPQSRQSKIEQSAELARPEAPPVDLFAGVAVGQAARRL